MATDVLRWSVGSVEIVRVEEAVTPVPPRHLVPNLTSAEIDGSRAWASPYVNDGGDLLLSVHTFVVRCGDAVLVVDTCVGMMEPRPLPSDATFLERLGNEIGGGLAAVDQVLCTHLHFDHVGWNLVPDDAAPGGVRPTFPHARYLFARKELGAVDDDVRSSVDPLLDAGLVDLIDSEAEHTLVANDAGRIWTISTPGHTPGHVSVMIESGAERALITGDVFHTPLQIAFPHRHASFDDEPSRATETRRRLVDLAADADLLVLGTHFAPPTAGHVVTSPAGTQFRGGPSMT